MRRQQLVDRNRHGDTLIEVMLSIAVFSFVAVMTINMMNMGVNTAQRTLETEMARNEIDAQAEALRFIHNGVIAERQSSSGESQFRKLWKSFTENASNVNKLPDTATDELGDGGTSFDINNMDSCGAAYGKDKHLGIFHAFIINTRLILPEDDYESYLSKNQEELESETINYYYFNKDEEPTNKFQPASLYPRIVYRSLRNKSYRNTEHSYDEQDVEGIVYNSIYRAEGLWINAVGNNKNNAKRSDYYDFYIRTCWNSAGSRAPDTITTVVRLYNPEVME